MSKKIEEKSDSIIFEERKIRTSIKGDLCLVDIIDVSNNKINKKEIQKIYINKTYEEDGNIYVAPNIIVNLLNEYNNKKAEELLNYLEKENIVEKKKEKKIISKKIIAKKKLFDSDSESESESESESDSDGSNNDSYNSKSYNNNSKKSNNYIENNNNKLFDTNNDSFYYSGKKFTIININGTYYFKGKDIAEYFGYTDTNGVVRDHIHEKYKFSYYDLTKNGDDILTPGILPGIKTKDKKNTIYISEPGLFQFVTTIKNNPKAQPFQDFVFAHVLPTLRKTGSYSIKGTSKRANSFINQLIKDTSQIENFYNKNNIITFFHANVFYLIVVGMVDGCYVIKFGHSMRIFERDYKEHKTTFGEQSKIIFVAETDNNILVETQFKKFLETKNALFEMEFGGKNRTELFKTSQNLSIEDAIEAVEMLIEKNPSNAEKKVKEYEQSKNKYELSLTAKLEISREKTTQIKIREAEKTKQEDAKAKQEEAKAIQMQEQTKQEQEKTKQERAKAIQMQELTKQKKREAKKEENKSFNIKEKSEKDTDMYLNFLNECTEKSDLHIHTVTLYKHFKYWFKQNNPNAKIPGNKTFISGIRKHVTLDGVRVIDKTSTGIKNLSIIK
jgi:prophage antirepressor-like protein